MAKTTKKTTKTPKVTNPASILEQENLMHALSYFPYFLGAAFVFFLGKTDKKKALHHIKYSLLISVAVVILMFILNSFFMSLLNLAYLGVSIFLALKAYKGEEIQVEILDTIEGKISEKVKK